jgi:hypothetical protein
LYSTQNEPLLIVCLRVEIISITIELERIRGWRPAPRKNATGEAASQTKKEATTSGREDGYIYKATFSLSKSETKRFNQFANANDKQAFDFRLAETRLGTVQFVGPFGGGPEGNNEFTTFLEMANVKETFAPFKDKVIWK